MAVFLFLFYYIVSILKVRDSSTFRMASTVSIEVRHGTPFSTDIRGFGSRPAFL